MKKSVLFFLILSLAVFSFTGCTQRDTPEINTAVIDTSQFRASYIPSFADRLSAEMPDDTNYMFSPLSVKMALALAANGASGETQKEILDTLDISDLQSFNSYSKKLIDMYSSVDVLKISIANSIWLNKSNLPTDFSHEYKKTAEDFYSASAGAVYRKNAVSQINGWVAEKTYSKIKSIITEPDFSAAIINAVYFSGAWENEFPDEQTLEDDFTDRNGNKTKIDFMNRTGDIAYTDINGITSVKLPYRNSGRSTASAGGCVDAEVNMYLIMSDSEVNADTFIRQNKDNFTAVNMKLSVPKFELEYSAVLNDELQKLGIKTAFTDSAQFQSMFQDGNVYIDRVLHKTYVKLTEKDTEAAAVTAILTKTSAEKPAETIAVKFDKPFRFVIKDDTNGEILFMGEYAFAS